MPMEAVIIPGKTIVHVKGIPVQLAVDTIVEMSRANMSLLIGHHYAFVPGEPQSIDEADRQAEALETTQARPSQASERTS